MITLHPHYHHHIGGMCKIISKQKPELNRGERPEGELSGPMMVAEPKRKQKDYFFSNNNSANEKPWALFMIALPTSLSPL